jgi:hypothetical protein
MSISQLSTPILLLAFNRPEVTQQVFDEIKKIKPLKLYIAIDGPREAVPDDILKIQIVRNIITNIDWNCELYELIQDKNLGCKNAVSSAISWFFEHEEQGIILEDDCLPHPDFFSYCETMLDYYKMNEGVMAITGDNFQDGQVRGSGSYYFSKYNHVWGWATWRRAWKHYDKEIKFWPKWEKSQHLNNLFSTKIEKKYWSAIFDKVFLNGIDTWDYQWTACIWLNDGITVTPNVNLVSNIGFGSDATHTTNSADLGAGVKTQPMSQIIHPESVMVDIEADKHVFMNVLGGKNLYLKAKVIRKFKLYINKIFSRAVIS